MSAVPQHNKNTAAIKALKERFVRIPSKTRFACFRDLTTGIEQGDASILVDFYMRQGGTEDHAPEYLLACLAWMYGDGFMPGMGQILNGNLLNLWKPSETQCSGKPVSEDQVALFAEFLMRWFPNELERKYFKQWLAHVVRNPAERILATPVLRSQHGVGKGFFAETLLTGLVGRSAVAVCGLKDVVGAFNDVIEGKTLLLIDEVYKSKKSTTDALKSFQGNATILLHRKHKPAITIDNFINFIVTSNDHIPLMLEKGDRRFWVPSFITHKVSAEETSEFINDNLKPWLRNEGGFQLVRDYLEQIDLAKFRPNDPPPSTQSKQELMGFSAADKLEELLLDAIAEYKVITVQWVKLNFSSEFENNLTDMLVVNALLNLGCKQRRSKSQKLYITPLGFDSGLSLNTLPADLQQHLPHRICNPF